MIRVTLTDSRRLAVRWQHVMTPRLSRFTTAELNAMSDEERLADDMRNRRWKTWCTIHELGADGKVPEGAVPLAHNVCSVNYRDMFDKAIGREISLRRALGFTGLDAYDRELVWAAYHARPRTEDAAVETARAVLEGLVCECGHDRTIHPVSDDDACGVDLCPCCAFKPVRFDVTRRHR